MWRLTRYIVYVVIILHWIQFKWSSALWEDLVVIIVMIIPRVYKPTKSPGRFNGQNHWSCQWPTQSPSRMRSQWSWWRLVCISPLKLCFTPMQTTQSRTSSWKHMPTRRTEIRCHEGRYGSPLIKIVIRAEKHCHDDAWSASLIWNSVSCRRRRLRPVP